MILNSASQENLKALESKLNGNINSAKTELNGNINSAKTELQGNINTVNNTLTNRITNVFTDIATLYDANKFYVIGDFCIYNEYLWKSLTGQRGTTPVSGSNWEQVSLANNVKANRDAIKTIASEWQGGSFYTEKGDYRLHNNLLWKALITTNSEPSDSNSNWQLVTVGNDLKTKLTGNIDYYSNKNLNLLTETGFYRCIGVTVNSPSPNEGFCLVFKIGDASILQFFISTSGNHAWCRSKWYSESFGSWTQIY